MRNVLLLEPNYKNKYPPIGLMKISTYHKILGDNVSFYKGDFKEFILSNAVELCIEKFNKIDNSIDWKTKYFSIYNYIKKRNISLIEDIGIVGLAYEPLLLNALKYYNDFYWKKGYLNNLIWDRIYITTLFTFNWDITIKTIEFAKQFVKSIDDIWVGGIMASVIPDEIRAVTGLNNIHVGQLNRPNILDKNNEIVIDDLELDYSILDEISYKYPENNAYYGYTTRGCVNKCDFCAVPILEPKFKNYISLKDKINSVTEKYGEKRNLLLLDNNLLASKKFTVIINEIKECGFDKRQKFIEPNQIDIILKGFANKFNERALINKSVELLNDLLIRLKGKQKQELYDLLSENSLLKPQTAIKQNVLKVLNQINPIYEKNRNKVKKERYVDFNQGVDATFLTKEKAKLLSQIPVRPLRIAFDSMEYEQDYLNAINNSKEAGIKHFSNYLLYNYKDDPIDLYQRLRINVELCESHNIEIYSFPMKYHPIFGDYNLNRDFIGPNWNRKFIRAVQTILNATKGCIGKGRSYFYKAFGKDENEYLKLLYMPDTFILYRFFFEKEGLTDEWFKLFSSLSQTEMLEAKIIIGDNDFKNISSLTNNEKILKLLNYYTYTRGYIQNSETELSKHKTNFDKLDKHQKYGNLEEAI
jgi:hypothetical protein